MMIIPRPAETGPRYFRFRPLSTERPFALQEAAGLCRCLRFSLDGVKWRDTAGQWQTATWEEVDHGHR